MRTFRDDEGRGWDVVTGRESWGAIFAIFVPRDAAEEVRQSILPAAGQVEATTELARLDERELRELLRDSRPKNS